MPKLIVSIDGVVIKEVALTKERTSLGRRPYNDIVIDNLAVSGEHAVLQLTSPESAWIEDLNSTNGTYVNGRAVQKQQLLHGDTIEVGKYKIRFAVQQSDNYDKTVIVRPGAVLAPAEAAASGFSPLQAADRVAPASTQQASIKVLSGAAAGREVALIKVVTTIGKPGVAVAAITKRPHGFVFAHVEGTPLPSVNGVAVGAEPMLLKNGDRLELAGTQMEFVTR
ncbi:FHA domain-containing protein [Xylophilus sp.]|uniref:FHA domain-containing protein n=1 Tax=Xylophilus sp. TaxID=2653893 RepID=UPI0013BDFB9F|nr:FHA domain-containing protein [Xylophilus sp.]KAF1046662.1 MAG: Glycogen accumulation regulator GarA [Xylophilus sp.]